MTLILDAGALIALERGDVDVVRAIEHERRAERSAVTHAGVVGQVWRGGTVRQSVLARVLSGVEILPLDDELGRRAGRLLALTRTSDVIDAALVLLANHSDWILTSDPDDIQLLAAAAGLHVDVIAV